MSNQVIYILVIGTIVLSLLVIFIVGFVIIYQQRHRKYQDEKTALKKCFRKRKFKISIRNTGTDF